MSETTLVKQVLIAVCKIRGVRAWRQNTGVAYGAGDLDRLVRGQSVRPVTYGVPGAADITGIIAPFGVRLEIECKIGQKYGQTKQQKFYQRMIETHGGFYILGHRTIEIVQEIEAFIRERSGQDNSVRRQDLSAENPAGLECQP